MLFYGFFVIEYDVMFLYLCDWNFVGIWYVGSFVLIFFLFLVYIWVGFFKVKD